jgi:hypothetical protein
MLGCACHTVIHAACLPCSICCRAFNFCAPDGCIGPPDIAGPGRFHPLPTHPVFAPVPEPPGDSAESEFDR